MSHVRVRLQLRGVRLEYHGTLSFFERVVDPLLAAVAVGGTGATEPAADAPPPGDDDPRPGPGAAADETADAEAAAPDAEEEHDGYRPDSADFGHFIRQLGPEAGDPDRQIVAFAFYLWNYEKREQFGEEEVAGCFRSLGLPVPEDAPDLYQDLAERRRFLDAGDEPGRWRLTQKGRNYVKTRLLGGA